MIIFLIFLSICLGLSLRFNFLYLIVPLIIFLIFILLRFKKLKFLVCLFTFALGVGVSYIQFSFNQETYEGIVVEAKDNYFIFSSKLERMYVSSYNHSYEAGDILKIKGTKSDLSFTRLESEFDFQTYLNKKGVYKKLEVSSIEVRFSTFLRLNSYRQTFLSYFDENTSNLLGSILFSYRQDSSNEVLTAISSLQLMRLASTSGLYIYFFLRVVSFLFSLKIKKKYADIIALGALSPYLIFTFPKFSVIRISLMYLRMYLPLIKNISPLRFARAVSGIPM